MRIGILSNLLHLPFSGLGGVERWAIELANGFSARGIDVDILANAPRGSRLQEPRLQDGIAVRAVGASSFAATWGLLRWGHEHPGAVLLSASPRYNLMAARARSLLGPRLIAVATAHEHLSRVSGHLSSARLRRRRRQIGKAYGRVDAIVAVSRAAAEDLAAHWAVPAERLHVIHNPLAPPPPAGPPPHPWLAPDAPPCLLAAGRLTPAKGFDLLLQACAIAHRETPLRLLVCGEGPEREALQALRHQLELDAQVQLLGHVEGLHDYLWHAHAFVLSSRYEGLPYVLLEALAAGTPCISTDCPSGPAEILDGGRHGRLVPAEDPAALAQALADTLRQPRGDREPLQRRAEEFSPQRAVEAYLALFERLRSSSGR